MVSHDNTVNGLAIDGGGLAYRPLMYDNTGAGIGSTGDENQFVFAADTYNNGNSGSHLGLGSEQTMNTIYFNSNFIKNTRYGFEAEGQATPGMFFHNAFGAGTQANSLGNMDYDKYRYEISVVTYTNDQSPYSNAASSNFAITGTGANETGYAVFTQVHPSYSGTTAVIDRGAAHQ